MAAVGAEPRARAPRRRPELYPGGPTVIGNDIARRRHLWVGWVLEFVGDFAWTREVVEFERESFRAQDDEIAG